MDIDQQTSTNTSDIAKLTTTVAQLATMFQFEAERAKEDRSSVKDMLGELKGLNEKISTMANVQKEMSQNSRDVTELRTRVDQLKEWKDKYDLSSFNSRIGALEGTNQREEGAAHALSTGADWFWRLFGPVVTIVVLGAFYYAFTHVNSYDTATFTSHSLHGPITGE